LRGRENCRSLGIARDDKGEGSLYLGGGYGGTEKESNTSGAKALIAVVFKARLKSCPDTKHEFPQGVKRGWFRHTNVRPEGRTL
jgi:hypothetical protein